MESTPSRHSYENISLINASLYYVFKCMNCVSITHCGGVTLNKCDVEVMRPTRHVNGSA